MKVICLLLFPFLLALNGCAGQIVIEDFPYELANATKTVELEKELREISGLSFATGNKLYCVQDEKGIVYLYDFENELIQNEIKFGKDNDFEGVAFLEDNIYALRSNGTLYCIKYFADSNKIDVLKINTFLDEKYDCEGLCYDLENNQLLIACKGSPGKKKNLKYVFRFNLDTQKLIEKPYLTIDIEDVYRVKKSTTTQVNYDKAMHKMGNNNTVFNPSGIAIHPITNNVYILSAKGNLLVVMNREGKMLYATHLKKTLFEQPEGITFDSNAMMYISSEGHNGKATIKSFKYISN